MPFTECNSAPVSVLVTTRSPGQGGHLRNALRRRPLTSLTSESSLPEVWVTEKLKPIGFTVAGFEILWPFLGVPAIRFMAVLGHVRGVGHSFFFWRGGGGWGKYPSLFGTGGAQRAGSLKQRPSCLRFRSSNSAPWGKAALWVKRQLTLSQHLYYSLNSFKRGIYGRLYRGLL